MLEATLQKRVIEFIGDLEDETGVDRQEICKFAFDWGNGRLPSPDEAYEALQRGEADFAAGRHMPVEELLADMENVIARYTAV